MTAGEGGKGCGDLRRTREEKGQDLGERRPGSQEALGTGVCPLSVPAMRHRAVLEAGFLWRPWRGWGRLRALPFPILVSMAPAAGH